MLGLKLIHVSKRGNYKVAWISVKATLHARSNFLIKSHWGLIIASQSTENTFVKKVIPFLQQI